MPQGVLPFQYEIEKKSGGMTALAGLPLHLDLAYVMGLRRMISEYVRARRSGLDGRPDNRGIGALDSGGRNLRRGHTVAGGR
jgi:hypothetical protein